MRLFVLVLAVFLSGYVHCRSEDTGQIYIDQQSTARPPKPTTAVSGGDDDEVSGSGEILSDESGSGSGKEETTTPDVKVYTPWPSRTTLKKTTEKPTEVPTETSKSTKSNVLPSEGTEKPTSENNNSVDEGYIVGGGIGKQEDDEPDSKAVAKQPYKVLTVEVIAAIVVGAVCAIILIAFLVYRLRKRDEGSYALTDGGFNDTYKLRGEGKEAFV